MSQSRSVRGKSLRSLCALVILLSAVGCVQSPDPWRPDARNVDGSLDGTVADARGTVDGSPQPDLPDATDASTPADLFPADVPSDLAADLAQDLSVPDLSPEPMSALVVTFVDTPPVGTVLFTGENLRLERRVRIRIR